MAEKASVSHFVPLQSLERRVAVLKEAHGVARAEAHKAQESESQLRHELQACVLVSHCLATAYSSEPGHTGLSYSLSLSLCVCVCVCVRACVRACRNWT